MGAYETGSVDQIRVAIRRLGGHGPVHLCERLSRRRPEHHVHAQDRKSLAGTTTSDSLNRTTADSYTS